jgi:iron(III) transport system permease protein
VTLVLNTLKLIAATLAIGLPLGALLGLLIARTNLPGRRFAAAALGLLLVVPLYLQAAAWQLGFGIFGWYTLMFGHALELALLSGWRGAIFVHSIAAIPWIALFVGLSSRSVEPQLEEAALLDASAWQVFRKITLRRTWPAIALAAVWVALQVATDMTVTDLFQVRTYAEEVYTDFAAPLDIQSTNAGPWPGVFIVTVLVAAAIAFCTATASNSARLLPKQSLQFDLGAWRWPAALVVLLFVLIMLGVPLVSLIYKAGVIVRPGSNGISRSWSAIKYVEIIAASLPRYHREIGWSLFIATAAACTAMTIAVPLAWFARRAGIKGLPAVLFSAFALAVPAPLLGIALIQLLNSPDLPWLNGMYHSAGAPMLAQAIRALPLAIFISWLAFRSIGQEQFEAAAIDGAGGLAQFMCVAVPQRQAALCAAWIAAFVAALNELPATLLLEAPGRTTLPVAVYQLMHGSGEDRLAGVVLLAVLGYAIAGSLVLLALKCSPFSRHSRQSLHFDDREMQL